MLTIDTINDLLCYNPSTGIFTWRVDRTGGIKAGDEAGYIQKDGYRRIKIKGKTHPAHRLAYQIVHGSVNGAIDHIDRNRDNNAIQNLRLCTNNQNQFNRLKSSANTSGKKGITWHKKSSKWQAAASIKGRKIHLGLFININDASLAYLNFCKKHHGEFYAGGER